MASMNKPAYAAIQVCLNHLLARQPDGAVQLLVLWLHPQYIMKAFTKQSGCRLLNVL
jgi:hypothetical protein